MGSILKNDGSNSIEIFDGVDFTQNPPKQSEYEECEFNNCNFSEIDLSEFKFVDCEFNDCNLSLAKIIETVWRDGVVSDLYFTQCVRPHLSRFV